MATKNCHNSCSSPGIKDIKDDEVTRTRCVQINPKGKTPIYSPKRKLECNIKTNLLRN